MATRYETQQQKERVKSGLRQLCLENSSVPGKLVPPERQLAEEYGVSREIIAQSLVDLIDEGLFYRVSRRGTFFGQPQSRNVEPYLLIAPYHTADWTQFHLLQLGFEERIAQLGGSCLMLLASEAEQHRDSNELPTLSGVFDATPPPLDNILSWDGVPWAGFGPLLADRPEVDMIRFDDVDGGRQATRHLLGLGHRRIAYLGMPDQDMPEAFFWSAEREKGWQSTMIEAGIEVKNLSFHGQARDINPKDFHDQIDVAKEATQNILKQADIEAVVAANGFAVDGMFAAFREAGIPAANWPAVATFDDDPSTSGAVISSLRLPWEAVGRTAADLLWERKNGRLTGAGQQRLILMRLIPRMSCRSRWGIASGLAKRYTEGEIMGQKVNRAAILNRTSHIDQVLSS